MLKRNNMLLASQLRKKFTGKCVTAIVAEAFVNGLPLDQKEVANESANLGKYATNVLSMMHPETLLDDAMESTHGNPHAQMFVKNLKGDISAVVEAAVDRTIKERPLSDTTTPEIVEQATLDAKEVKKLVDASKRNGIESVAKVVRDKMIKTIKDEKAAYEEAESLKEKVKEVIQDNPTDDNSVGAPADTSAPNQELGETSAPSDIASQGEGEASEKGNDTLESYLNHTLSPTDVRDHISFFSRLQDVCMEGILHSTENWTGEVPYETMLQVTLESTLPFFDLSKRSLEQDLKALQIVTEAAVEDAHDEFMTPEDKAHKMKKVAKTSFICTICILTLLETLKTMHLKNPTVDQVRDFISKPTDTKALSPDKLDTIELKINKTADEIKKSVALGSLTAVETGIAKESLANVKSMLESIEVNSLHNEQKSRILGTIDKALEAVAPEQKSYDQSSPYVARAKNANLVALEHSINLLTRKPLVKKIQIVMESRRKTDNGLTVALEARGLADNGQIMDLNTFNLAAYPEFGDTIPEVVQECSNYINLGTKPVSMYFSDSGYATQLN